MEIERPFRIKIPSHKEPVKANEEFVATEKAKPLGQQFRDDFEALQQTTDGFRAQKMNPSSVERQCKAFEDQWTEKMERTGFKHLAGDMQNAVDAVRTEEKPDLTFVAQMREPQFQLTKDATRRLAKDRTRDDLL